VPSGQAGKSATAERFHRLFQSAVNVEAPDIAVRECGGNRDWLGDTANRRLVAPRYGTGAMRFRRTSPSARALRDEEPHNPAGLLYVRYAREAAQRLVNHDVNDGKLNTACIDDMLAALRKDEALAGHADQRAHLERSLLQLRDNPQLQAAINGICEEAGRHPRGPAKNAIRATLNLPLHAPVGRIEARQAILTALLGDLRQEAGAGSRAATALAKFVHQHMPLRALRDWKSLLEGNHLSLHKGNTRIQVPLNNYARNEGVQLPLALSADGRLADGALLETLPGMHDALRALGVPESEMGDAVAAALARMGLGGGDIRLSCRQVIENIARHPPGRADADKRAIAAIDAFAGADEVKLLRIWETTLASAAHNGIASRHKDKLGKSVVHGMPGEHGADPLSLTAKAEACMEPLAKADPRYHGETVTRAREEFLRQIDSLMDQRLLLLFDAGEYTYLGASVLHDQLPGEPGAVRRLDSAEDFKLAMKQLIEQAARKVGETIGAGGGDTEFARKALRFMADSLMSFVGKAGESEFIRHVLAAFADTEGNAAGGKAELPWKIRSGGDPGDLATNYFGKPVAMVSSADAYPPDPARPNDARHILDFLLDRMAGMGEGMQAEIARSPDTFRVLASVDHDVLSLMPGRFVEGWSGAGSRDEWIARELMAPAAAHAQAVRSEPPLQELLADTVGLIRHHAGGDFVPQAGREQLPALIAKLSGEPGENGAYSLQAVYQALTSPGVYAPAPDHAGHEKFLDLVASALLQVVPPRAVEIGDTHRESPANPGSTERVALLGNPYRGTLNLQFMDEVQDGRAPVAGDWLAQAWNLMTTPLRDGEGAAVTGH
jgi:hypothetical protein